MSQVVELQVRQLAHAEPQRKQVDPFRTYGDVQPLQEVELHDEQLVHFY